MGRFRRSSSAPRRSFYLEAERSGEDVEYVPFKIRFPRDQFTVIRWAAAKYGLTVEDFVRRMAWEEAADEWNFHARNRGVEEIPQEEISGDFRTAEPAYLPDVLDQLGRAYPLRRR